MELRRDATAKLMAVSAMVWLLVSISLGLVMAAGLRGRPLDMGGSHVDVIEKRSRLPDLSDIDETLRPLIEAMLQPDPDARPPTMTAVAEWLRAGFAPAYGRSLTPAELAETASLLQPAGLYGPSFLTPKNYFVFKEYNTSDLYVLFVGHLSDRIADGRPFETPWSKNAQLRTEQVEAMQKTLTARGLYGDKIDGKAGMLTRAALGAYQKANGLKLDCWPTAAVLSHMQARR